MLPFLETSVKDFFSFFFGEGGGVAMERLNYQSIRGIQKSGFSFPQNVFKVLKDKIWIVFALSQKSVGNRRMLCSSID